jgi:hypothetical protein
MLFSGLAVTKLMACVFELSLLVVVVIPYVSHGQAATPIGRRNGNYGQNKK